MAIKTYGIHNTNVLFSENTHIKKNPHIIITSTFRINHDSVTD